jgi:DNA repair protein RadD
MPTGTGKSLVIAAFIREAYMKYPGQRFMMLTHVKELIGQNFKTLRTFWPTAPCGVYSAGLKQRQSHFPITFAGIASVVNSPELFGHIDLVFIDEAHLVSPKEGTMYQRFLRKLKIINPNVKAIGLTATHYRLGQGLLTEPGSLFTDVCFNATSLESFNWLIDEGYICPLIPKKTASELKTDGVMIQGGEFVLSQLQEAVDKNDVTYAALKETISLGEDRAHWLVFASGVDHAVHIRDMLDSLGISATCVHSRMSDNERDENLAGFKSGKYRAMVNNGILTTGFDFPELDLIVMLRPTQSPGLWVQMLGRGTRPVYAEGHDISTRESRIAAQHAGPKKNCLVLDFAGNTRRLGPINDPVMPRKKGAGLGLGVAPVKLCEHCGTYNHASARFCISCKAEFKFTVKINQTASTAALIAGEGPKVENFNVNRIVYVRHKKEGRPDSIKVSYYCGLRLFEEWICLEHEGYARKKAREWWRQRWPGDVSVIPESTTDALKLVEYLKIPRIIKVWINRKHPEIISYVY